MFHMFCKLHTLCMLCMFVYVVYSECDVYVFYVVVYVVVYVVFMLFMFLLFMLFMLLLSMLVMLSQCLLLMPGLGSSCWCLTHCWLPSHLSCSHCLLSDSSDLSGCLWVLVQPGQVHLGVTHLHTPTIDKLPLDPLSKFPIHFNQSWHQTGGEVVGFAMDDDPNNQLLLLVGTIPMTAYSLIGHQHGPDM